MTDVDEAFRYRIEECKSSVSFAAWWCYASLRFRFRPPRPRSARVR